MTAHIRHAVALIASLLMLNANVRAEASPIGVWRTVDDASGKPKALVRISEEQGVFMGRIVRLLDPEDPADARCEDCTDDRRGQPVVGLAIIRNVRSLGTVPRTWGGGEILDPEDGRTYSVRLKLDPENRQMEVRGYLGVPALGRSQTWFRVE